MLDVEQTNLLIRQAKNGDATAKETLLKENSNLIKSIVKRYLNKGVEYDDLFQLAGMGLLKAINGFDESFGVRFSTYAVPMISGEIKRFMRGYMTYVLPVIVVFVFVMGLYSFFGK